MKYTIRYMLVTLGCMVASQAAMASVWDDQNHWSSDWEAKYSHWVAHEFKTDTFAVREGNVLATPVNAVDIPYLTRILFAYNNQLPFAIRSRNGRAMITNRLGTWDTTTAGLARLAAFIKEVRQHISFARLSLDSFPLALHKQAIQPGAFYLYYRSYTNPDDAPSVMFVKSVQEETGFQTFLFTSRADDPRALVERAPLIVQPPNGITGYMAMRWPTDKLDGLENHATIGDPRFSATAQYQDSLALQAANPNDNFSFKVQEAISGTAVNVQQAAYQDTVDLCLLVQSRVDWVNEAQEYLTVQRAQNAGFLIEKNTPAWNLLSTPFRDSQIAIRFEAIRKKYRTQPLGEFIEGQYAKCTIAYGLGENQKMTLLDYRKIARTVSSDPNDAAEWRWGSKPKINAVESVEGNGDQPMALP